MRAREAWRDVTREDWRADAKAGEFQSDAAHLLLATSRTLRLVLRWQEVDQRSRAPSHLALMPYEICSSGPWALFRGRDDPG